MRRPREYRRRHIYLIGFSGSGKSAIGARLAAKLKRWFIDTDKETAARFKASIPSVFEHCGERAFRREETSVIKRIAQIEPPAVVALGGGSIERMSNRRLMQRSGIVIYLRCSLRELCRRLRDADNRPLLRAGKSRLTTIQKILVRRKPIYETADITVSTTHHTVGVIVDNIAERLAEYERANRR